MKMDNLIEGYNEEVTPVNEIKGFTKSFVKRTKDKKKEDANIKELLSFQRDNRLVFGEKVAEKLFKRGLVEKVFLASNCKDLVVKKMQHYGKLVDVAIVKLDIENTELAQRLEKPFLTSVISVRIN